MTSPTPERDLLDDDLDRAYARAQALTQDGAGPSASVRANVLAAALAVAARADSLDPAAPVARPALMPVAAPVADVARGRARAINLSSWRVRSGAALCALVIVGLASWRFDASRRFDGGTQVAVADAPATQRAGAPPSEALAPPDKRSLPASPQIARTAPVPEQDLAVAPAKPRELSAAAPKEQPAAVASIAEPPPVAARAIAAAAPAVPVVDNPVVAADERPQRVEVTGSPALRSSLESAKQALPAPAARAFAGSLGPRPAPLQAAADSGDADALQKLLADPATRVDSVDSTGRTALLHAVLAQRVAAVRVLLAAGADPGRADAAGLTPRAAAQAGANAEIAALLAAPR